MLEGFGPENNTQADFQFVQEFIVENSAEYPILMDRAQAIKSILSEACPECTQTQGVIALLLCFDGRIDDATRGRLSVDARALADDWNSSMEVIRERRPISGSSIEIKQLHLALHIIRMQEFLERDPHENPAEEYTTALNLKNKADFILEKTGNARAPELESMYKMHVEQVVYRASDAFMRLQGRDPGPAP